MPVIAEQTFVLIFMFEERSLSEFQKYPWPYPFRKDSEYVAGSLSLYHPEENEDVWEH